MVLLKPACSTADYIKTSENTPDRQQSKTLLTIDERGSHEKWQSKTLSFLTICDLRSSIVLAFSIAAYLVLKTIIKWALTREYLISLHANRRRSACGSAKSDQRICYKVSLVRLKFRYATCS